MPEHVIKEVMTSILLEFDPNSEEFKNAYDSYCEVINRKAKPNDMLNDIAVSVAEYGTYRMIEGIGYVRYKDHCTDKDNFCGVTVLSKDTDIS